MHRLKKIPCLLPGFIAGTTFFLLIVSHQKVIKLLLADQTGLGILPPQLQRHRRQNLPDFMIINIRAYRSFVQSTRFIPGTEQGIQI